MFSFPLKILYLATSSRTLKLLNVVVVVREKEQNNTVGRQISEQTRLMNIFRDSVDREFGLAH